MSGIPPTPLYRIGSRTFVWALDATLGTLITLWVVVPPAYMTNDDTTIRRNIEGVTAPTATPTGYILMAHSLLGWAATPSR
jgi:hypothetical protein